MKKIINTLVISSLVASCGVKTEDKNLTSNLIKTPLVQKATIKASDLDPLVRSITLIAYPNEAEMEGFEFVVDDEVFSRVFEAQKTEYKKGDSSLVEFTSDIVSYGDKMPRGIAKNLSNAKKVSDLVKQLVNIGDVRDKAYLAFVKNEVAVSEVRDVVVAADETVSNDLTFYKIKDAGDYKNKLILSKLDGYNVSKVTTKTCDQLLTKRIDDVAMDLLSEEEKSLLASIVENCNSITTQVSVLNAVEKAQKNLIYDAGSKTIVSESIYYNGKTYVTNMLDALRDHSGKTYLSTGVYKESILDGTYPDPEDFSTVVLNSNGDGFETFKLRLDFLGRGVKTYSVENGAIQDLYFTETSLGEKVLHFKLVTKDVTVSAKLGMTFIPYMGLRFIGDADFKFANGIKNRGVMKIEVDSLNDKTLPVSL